MTIRNVSVSLLLIFAANFFVCFADGKFSFAQAPMVNRIVPQLPYFNNSKRAYDEGNFPAAIKNLIEDSKHAVKFPLPNGVQAYWIDSICFQTMIGECHYQMGNYEQAMVAFNTAVDIYLDQPLWLSNITYNVGPVLMQRPPLPWGGTTRKGGIGNFSKCTFQLLQQSPRMIALGGAPAIANQSTLTTIHADEIVTRMAIMIRRRAQILGPLSRFDDRTIKLNKIFSERPCPPNHFSGAWVDVLYGLTLSAIGDYQMAVPQLEKGILMQGTFDHQLTAYALHELGNIAIMDGKPAAAQQYFYEASLCATYFGDSALIGESFTNIANAQKLIDQTKPILQLHKALAYFSQTGTTKYRFHPGPQITVPILHEIANDALTAGNIKLATESCMRAKNLIRVADTVAFARNLYISAKIEYLAALVNYTAGKPFARNLENGDKNLFNAIKVNSRVSLWMCHLAMLENLFQKGFVATKGVVSPHEASDLYGYLLRDPTVTDWSVRPMDSMTLMTSVDPRAYQRWFIVALMLAEKEKAFDITELARRAAFYSLLQRYTNSSMQLGPRHLALRIMFEGTGEDLADVQQERNMLALDFTRFEQLSGKVRDLKKDLFNIPIVPKEASQIEQQKKLFAELQTVSVAQEMMLRPIALSNTKVTLAFPPIVKIDQFRKELPEKTAMLSFYEDAIGNMHGFLVDRRSLQSWQIEQPQREPALGTLIANYLDAIGNKREANSQLRLKEDIIDSDLKWKRAGNVLLKRLLGKEREVNFTELIVVPYGRLWYVPFESLTVQVGNEFRPLISASNEPITVRYAPMASLGIPQKTGNRSKLAQTLVIYGNLTGGVKNDSVDALDAIDRYTKENVIKNMVLMPSREKDLPDFPGTASVYATQVKQLVVLDDIPTMNLAPLAWSPFTSDKKKLQQPVSSWLTLPWGAPELVVLPAFHTPAENALKPTTNKTQMTPNGNDIFLTAMTLEACGTKTMLISRWRPGGRSTYDLIGEFMKAYQEMPAANAWRQAILNVGVKRIDIDKEPRIRTTPKEKETIEAPLATHPFFWSPFILIDRGELPENTNKTKLDTDN
ncbi:MAG: hypothetical protein LBQ66_12830 [Planctomycetaceae bacterium]|jgi:tetratricopeptide (TPR) repeat protein|nr:hypothetical protein [Planctomycetaceae bacterium]